MVWGPGARVLYDQSGKQALGVPLVVLSCLLFCLTPHSSLSPPPPDLVPFLTLHQPPHPSTLSLSSPPTFSLTLLSHISPIPSIHLSSPSVTTQYLFYYHSQPSIPSNCLSISPTIIPYCH
ncbi:hypothetical protein Pmani_017522 [Petrolisthes manimaculis]|uniref:Uncharacterized protein n=1 Tax=Petrolisthes manimaculis TaxID=1843537 RepID=A0AAE1PN78_9EUCA|nr:hypothetical protein Pmani_017522 [Petrolisthes manimaculis]